MAFVRIKQISGKEYGYLVENSWTGSGSRQKVAKYLGRLIKPQKTKSEDLGLFLGLPEGQGVNEWMAKSSFREIATKLVLWELANHEINGASSLKINVESAEILDDKSKPVVIALNDGFLCSHTAKKLLEYEPRTDYSGYNLADALTAAGIAVNKEVFISLFGKAQAAGKREEKIEEKTADEFYY